MAKQKGLEIARISKAFANDVLLALSCREAGCVLGGGLDRHEERLRRGASHLRSMRDGEHQWRRFPFWYTVLALSEMDSTDVDHLPRLVRRPIGRAGFADAYHERGQLSDRPSEVIRAERQDILQVVFGKFRVDALNDFFSIGSYECRSAL